MKLKNAFLVNRRPLQYLHFATDRRELQELPQTVLMGRELFDVIFGLAQSRISIQ